MSSNANAKIVDVGAVRRWRTLTLVALALVLSMATWFSATAVASELQRAFALTPTSAAWLTNAVQIGFVVGALGLSISGLIDVVPTPRLMATAALVAALANIATMLAPNATVLLLTRALNGLALAGVYPPAMKLIATWFRSGRGFAMGAAIAALTLGSSVPYLVKAVGAAFDWHFVLAVAAGAAAAAAVLFALTEEGPHAGASSKPDLKRVAAVVRDADLSLANLGYYGHMWELYALWGWFLAFAADAERLHSATGHLSPALLTFMMIAVGALGCVAGGLVADRIGRTATTAMAMAVSGVCALAIGFVFAGPPVAFVTVSLVWGFAVIADSAQFSAMASELADADTTGAALALQVGGGYALTIIAVRIVPMLADVVGWRWALMVLAPGPLVGVFAMLLLRRRPAARKIAGGLR